MVASTSSVNGEGTSWVTRSGCRRAPSSMRRASATFMAMRASHSTCLPASRAARVISQWRLGHVPMQIASVSLARTSSCQESYTRGMPNSRATRSDDSRLRLATLTISTPGMALSPGMCRTLVLLPAPTMPMRRGVVVMVPQHTSGAVSRGQPGSRGMSTRGRSWARSPCCGFAPPGWSASRLVLGSRRRSPLVRPLRAGREPGAGRASRSHPDLGRGRRRPRRRGTGRDAGRADRGLRRCYGLARRRRAGDNGRERGAGPRGRGPRHRVVGPPTAPRSRLARGLDGADGGARPFFRSPAPWPATRWEAWTAAGWLVLLTAMHQAAAATWVGGLTCAMVVGARADAARAVAWLRRFFPVAASSVAALALTGIGLSFVYVASPGAAIGTSYGAMVLAKIALFAAMLGMAWLNHRGLHVRLALGRPAAASRLPRSLQQTSLPCAGASKWSPDWP